MKRRRMSVTLIVLGLAAFPLSCVAFIVTACSRPGSAAPSPLATFPITNYYPAFSPDARLLAFEKRGIVHVCRLGDQTALETKIELPVGTDWPLTFDSDSKTLFASHDGKLTRYDVSNGKRVDEIRVPTTYIEQISISPDGHTISAIVDHDYREPVAANDRGMNSIIVFRLDNLQSQRRLITNRVMLMSPLKFSRDGRLAAAVDIENDLLLVWKASDWSVTFSRSIPGLHAAAVSSLGDKVAWLDGRGGCGVWSLTEQRDIWNRTVSGSTQGIYFHESGDVAVVCNHWVFMKPLGTMLTVFDADGRRRAAHRISDGYLQAFAISPDGEYVAATGGEELRLWRWRQLVPTK